ncbi:heavy metal-binding domain-containing protein [Rufibacter roseolus]|uniref:heavy metal-binding domain-containing protein n=1 Tax=Rufibacter roseolus TaxID=2817375 RepID=UPI001B305883|nr:heavy metal-binding domain-containing protein [Rufibacter roseolus]
MRKTFLAWALLLGTLASVSSCNGSPKTEEPAATTDAQQGTAVESTAAQGQQLAYLCPMECEGSASMEPGKCPVCNMDLEKNPAYQASADSTATL